LAIELVWYGLFAMALLGLGQRAGNVLAVAVPASLLVLAALSLVVGARIPLGRPGLIHAAVLGFQVYRFRTGALSRRALWWNVASFVLITWLASIVSFGVFSHARLTLAQVIGPWTLAVVVFLGVVLTPALRHARALDRGPLPALGAASYSIYLLHPVAINLAGQYAPPTLLVPVSLALTGLLALGGYRLVERPGIAFARWLTRRPAVAVPPAASARVAA
jgi:peptidoglycan/LPS O-acetylase OafA/YrhL